MKKLTLYRSIRSKLRKVRAINIFPRMLNAMGYYNSKYWRIVVWGLTSREDTNFTYDLTDENLMYLGSTISVITDTPFNKIMNFMDEAKNDHELSEHVINKTKNSGFSSVSDFRCDFGRRLGWYAVARAIKPKIVVETGVDKGHGSVLLCSALLRNRDEGFDGKYFGLDIDPNAGYLLDGRYREVGEILYGDSIKTLTKFEDEIDLFINDSDHSPVYEYNEYLTIKYKLSEKSIILGDNAHSTDKLFKFSLENDRKFIFFHEVPKDHWYPGGGIGFSYQSQ